MLKTRDELGFYRCFLSMPKYEESVYMNFAEPPLKLEDAKVKERVRVIATDAKRQRAMQEYLSALRAKAKIVFANAKS